MVGACVAVSPRDGAGGGGANQRAPWHLEMRGASESLPILGAVSGAFPNPRVPSVAEFFGSARSRRAGEDSRGAAGKGADHFPG
jgi:hypothetical protein